LPVLTQSAKLALVCNPTTGEWVRTFAIIPTDANELVAEIHDRMPLILAAGDYQADRVPLPFRPNGFVPGWGAVVDGLLRRGCRLKRLPGWSLCLMAQLAPRPAYARAATSTDSGAQWRRHIALRKT
jgi:hypothetical protein